MPNRVVENIVKSIIDITEEIKTKAFKKEKDSLDDKFLEYTMITFTAYTRLIKRLQEKSIISKDDAKKITDYLYRDFVIPISDYLGFMDIPIRMHKEP